jgi:hypothetical protein
MSSIAVDALDDAGRATRDLLLPVDVGRWLRLAVIAVFVGGLGGGGGGGGANANAGSVNVGSGDLPVPPFGPGPGAGRAGGLLPVTPTRVVLLVAGVLAAVVLLWLVFAAVAGVMEFVLLDAVTTRDVRIRAPFRRDLGPGLRLFAFRLGLLLLGLAVVAPLVVGAFGLGLGPGALVASLLLLVPLVVVLGLLGALVSRLTTDLVVPTMAAEGVGVLRGWRRLLPEVRANLRAFALYVVVRVVLGVAAAVAVGLVTGFVVVVLAVPFLLVGGGLALALSAAGGGAGVLAVAAVLAVPAALLGLLAVGAVQAPVVVFFRYYALFVLGAVVPSLDLVPDLRDETEDAADDAAGDDGDGNGGGDADADGDGDADADGDGNGDRNGDGGDREVRGEGDEA